MVTQDLSLVLLHEMIRIRFVEEEIARRYGENKMRCPVHLSVGQEAVAVAAGKALRVDDMAVSGHRAHAHYLGKGGNLTAMLAELMGKASGCSGGKGGSMHLIDESVGFMGSTAIVAGTVPVGVGLAYGMKLAATDQVACVFLGDAVAETGVFYESLNFAALKSLPVLFVCENNLYSVYTPLHKRQPEGRGFTRSRPPWVCVPPLETATTLWLLMP
jgi:pyruvate dehydrogenase E1 component alpha subunit